ncbi:S26 family signal peptidase (plasmid) [Agrobacterium vitis]|uniref:S26 family signal peptidase n=1 Tax=Agrobacterium vitis TaxID=373 RepID=UPI0012E7B400|nr:S26 family signal peptidase [Agrobacterium vitis]MVA27071.1 S26 family signal peptidase [Agrobacterium vitis]
MTRLGYVMATCLTAMGAVAAAAIPTPIKLIWNSTASAPVGFYTVEPVDATEVPELVAVLPPEPFASFMVERGYVGRGVPLLKRVLGVPGQRVCRTGRTITVDAIEMGEALERDRMGRDLPVWQGCRVIAEGQLFLMNGQVRDSLDGRYFGTLPASAVIGRAIPLYTDDDGNGRFVWRAQTR